MEPPNEHMPDEERLRTLLVGKSIIHAETREEEGRRGPAGFLTLSDGTVLKVWGHDGWCICDSGCYPLTNLNGCENVITNVTVEARQHGDDMPCWKCGKNWCWDHEDKGYYRIFVWAEEKRVNIASFEGTDGNGYYGTGWWLAVTNA